MAEVMTTSEVAEQLGTDPKTLRKFFRSDQCSIEPVGQGKRYAITKSDIKELKTAFGAWSSGKVKKATDDDAEPPADKAPKKSKKKTAKPTKEDEIIEDLDDAEPTAEDLEDLDDLVEDLDLD